MAKAIMVQGTMSNSGKSFLVAALCRIFKQDGYKVAPFKSQNMALNSFITEDGLEMGRAQVMQAEASGIKPDIRMNPILLKPTNDKGSQVILNGEVLGNVTATDYFKNKTKLIPDIMKAYKSLDEEYDIIVLEGAGSPAEINLKNDDIVNMGMAKLAKAPVLLVGDIDRGGVFAALAGTMLLLDEDEKARVKGIVINKFRGDVDILKPGLSMLEDITKVPVIGVIPHIQVDIDDEDSLSSRLETNHQIGLIDIVVIKLPRLSNFTDFNVFERVEGVTLRYVNKVEELKNPDMIILPGTKNTMGDLLWLRQVGLESAILKYSAAGGLVFGICGGYQMLGEVLEDPDGVEEGGKIKGMGLLQTKTLFDKEKIRTRVQGKFGKVTGILEELSNKCFEGYEIHMGKTTTVSENTIGTCLTTLTTLENPEDIKEDGYYNNNVYGSYVHGIFDQGEVASTIVSALLCKKGIKGQSVMTMDFDAYKESQYDLLAECARKSLDMDMIYKILEDGMEQGGNL